MLAARFDCPMRVNRAVYSPDGRTLAAWYAPEGCEFLLWDVDTRRLRAHVKPKPVHDVHAVASVAFSPDGRTLAGAAGYCLLLWDVATGKELHQTAGHDAGVGAVAFAPTGDRLAAAADDDSESAVIRKVVGEPTGFVEVDARRGHDDVFAAVGFQIRALAGDALGAGGGRDYVTAKDFAVVTGGSTGIGAEICRQMLEAGYEVISLARRKPAQSHVRLHAVEVDLRVQGMMARLSRDAISCTAPPRPRRPPRRSRPRPG